MLCFEDRANMKEHMAAICISLTLPVVVTFVSHFQHLATAKSTRHTNLKLFTKEILNFNPASRQNIKCININRYADWLLKNKVKIDSWCSDKNYTNFLIDYLKTEDAMDAIARSIETTIDLAKDAGIETKDCLRYANRNRLAYAITTGKISPWMLYQSSSGIEFLENLDESQQKMIIDYINPEQWAIRFKRYPEVVSQVKELLNAAGY